ncbi:hypothetical protein LTR08_004800 [Meristemomyces frigidus]|nr:hypothetical protein LTR08_004800 [Meristemomyces frigidus]
MNATDTLSSLSNVDRRTFGDDESTRMQALSEARALVARLEKPWESVDRMVWSQPTLMLTVKTASDMGIFAALTSSPQNSEQLGNATGADPILVSRLLRMLAVGFVIQEVDVDTYIASEFSNALGDGQGIVNGIHHFYDVGVQQMAALPAYLQKTGYRNPTDTAHPPFEDIMGMSSYWDWFEANPKAHAHFNTFLSSIRVGQPPWPSYYPLSQLLEAYDGAGALCVDVGGGKGRDLKHMADAIGDQHRECVLVLQDLPSVIKAAEKESLPSQIQLIAHNFFDVQPCKGARAYFLHSILHDWPDVEACKILTQLKQAGRPGYSKIVLLEAVMPERVKDVKPRMAALDINMMAHFSALERTEKQWRRLLDSVGLRWVKFWELKGSSQGVIEVEM